MELTHSQETALEYFRRHARARKSQARQLLAHILRMSDVRLEEYELAVDRLRTPARVVTHFHPDRPGPGDRSVAQSLMEQGIYRSQFETWISNGSVSARPGGDRDLWEQRLYGAAYSFDSCSVAERPKYGALDVFFHADGPAPSFGSCFLVLKPEVMKRCTFTWTDSHQCPEERGTWDEWDDILAPLLKEVFTRDFCLGEHRMTVRRLVSHLHALGSQGPLPKRETLPKKNFHHFVETQIHGELRLGRDVEHLVADPSFRGTSVGAILESMSERYRLGFSWSPGFELSIDQVPGDFRGPAMPSLARRIARDSKVDAHAIGVAAASLKLNPSAWEDRGSEAEVFQELKLLWHVLVKYGSPRLPSTLG